MTVGLYPTENDRFKIGLGVVTLLWNETYRAALWPGDSDKEDDMSEFSERRRSDTELFDTLPTKDVDIDPTDSEMLNPAGGPEVVDVPPTSDLVERINDMEGISGDDRIVTVTDDGYVTSGDIAGEDVIDYGISSDAGLGGLGVNIDDLPGDEESISREHRATTD